MNSTVKRILTDEESRKMAEAQPWKAQCLREYVTFPRLAFEQFTMSLPRITDSDLEGITTLYPVDQLVSTVSNSVERIDELARSSKQHEKLLTQITKKLKSEQQEHAEMAKRASEQEIALKDLRQELDEIRTRRFCAKCVGSM